MTCDFSNCKKVRVRHPEFATLCRRIGIDIDSDGIISDLQQSVVQENTKTGDGEMSIQDQEDSIAPRRIGTITSVREDGKFGYIDGGIFVHHNEFHEGKQQIVLHGKVAYETYYCWKKKMFNAAKVFLIAEETNEVKGAQESHNHANIITEVIHHGACGYITPICITKRIFVHNTHIVNNAPMPLKIGMKVMYMEQMDLGRKVAVNCRLSNDECIGKELHTSKRDRSRSTCRIRDAFEM